MQFQSLKICKSLDDKSKFQRWIRRKTTWTNTEFCKLKRKCSLYKTIFSRSNKTRFHYIFAWKQALDNWFKSYIENYLEYRETETECDKKAFLNDLTTCINQLGNKHYEQIENTHQAGFILMYIPIESCVNLIYTDPDFRKILELANAHNIIITGTSSIIVTLRLVANLWTTKTVMTMLKIS